MCLSSKPKVQWYHDGQQIDYSTFREGNLNIQWYHDGQQKDYLTFRQGNLNVLEIHNVKYEDAGTYECTGYDEHKVLFHSKAHVVVTSKKVNSFTLIFMMLNIFG